MGALAGAELSLTVAPDKKSGLRVAIQTLLDPAGQPVSVAGLVAERKNALVLSATLDQSGTWTAVVRSQGGATGTLSYKYKVKQPKGARFALPD